MSTVNNWCVLVSLTSLTATVHARRMSIQATALEAEEFLTQHNFRPLVEWLTAEIVLNRPSDPFPFMRELIDSRIQARGPRGYDPAEHTDYLQDCYANASAAFEAAVLRADEEVLGGGETVPEAQPDATGKVTATRRAAVLDSVVDATSAIAKCAETEELARLVQVSVGEIIHADAVVVHLMNEDATLLFEVGQSGGAPVVVGKGITGQVGQSGETLYLTQASAEAKYAEDAGDNESVLCAAVRDEDGSVIGTVTATSAAAGGFTRSCLRVTDALLVAAGSAFARIAVRKAGVFARQQLDATKRALQTVNRIASTQDEAEVQDLVGLLTSAMALLSGADACTLWVVSLDGARMQSAGVHSDAQGARVMALSEGLAGACASTGAIVVVSGAASDPRWNAEKEEQCSVRTEAALCVPLRAGGATGVVVGVAQLLKGVSPGATSIVHFSDSEQQLVNMIVHAAGAVVAVRAPSRSLSLALARAPARARAARRAGPPHAAAYAAARASSHPRTPPLPFRRRVAQGSTLRTR
jgi:GAF domain-containing protein